LSDTDLTGVPEPAKSYLRRLWGAWWPHRAEHENLVVSPADLWQCAGVRPANHPQRRVGALAEIARHWPRTRAALCSGDPATIHRHFDELHHEFWDHHCTLTAPPSRARMALVGAERVEGILMNVAFPMVLREEGPVAFERMCAIPALGYNARVKTAALRLFGVEAASVPQLRQAIYQQGLLQVADDFCRQDITDCQRCPLHEQLAQWK